MEAAIETFSRDIADLNLKYLTMARSLLKSDPDVARMILGVTPEMENILSGMSMEEIIQISQTPALHFKFSPKMPASFWNSLKTFLKRKSSSDPITIRVLAVAHATKQESV